MAHPTLLDGMVGVRRPLKRGLIAVIVALGVLHVLAVVTASFWRTTTPSVRSTIGAWFHLDSEAGLGTWFAVVQLALAAVIAALIALAQRGRGASWLGWAGAATLLAVMSMDEQVLLHESLGLVGSRLGVTVGGQQVWFVPALVLVLAVGIALLPFVVRLPRRTRRGLLGGGALYLLGAVGFEALSWVWVVVIADDPAAALSPVVGMLQLGEETLELLAVTVVIATLLDYAAESVRADSTTAPPALGAHVPGHDKAVAAPHARG